MVSTYTPEPTVEEPRISGMKNIKKKPERRNFRNDHLKPKEK